MHIFFSVGEPSGDVHAAKLIEEVRNREPAARFSGYGGPRMAEAGCELNFELTTMAVMGVAAVLPLIWKFYKLVQQAETLLREQRPDAVVLVDFPGFNWWIARKAKKLGIPVVYYMPPQLWAWASWRIRRVRKFIDFVLSPLQFETDWYRNRGVDVQFVGHPFFDEIAEHRLNEDFLQSQRRKPGRIIGVLPGSRNQEVQRNWPIQLTTLRRLHKICPDTRFLIACYNEQHRNWCREHWGNSGGDLPIELCVGRTSEIIEVAESCLMVSGSVSLEVLGRRTPAVVMYACSWPFYLFGKLVIHCRFFTLANLIADRELMPEFAIRGNPTKYVRQMAGIMASWIRDSDSMARKRSDLETIAQQATEPGATARAAEVIIQRISLHAQTDKAKQAA